VIAILAITCVILTALVATLAVLYARARATSARAEALENELADDLESTVAEQFQERRAVAARATVTREELDRAYAEIRTRRDPGDARRGLRQLFSTVPDSAGAAGDFAQEEPTLPDRER